MYQKGVVHSDKPMENYHPTLQFPLSSSELFYGPWHYSLIHSQ